LLNRSGIEGVKQLFTVLLVFVSLSACGQKAANARIQDVLASGALRVNGELCEKISSRYCEVSSRSRDFRHGCKHIQIDFGQDAYQEQPVFYLGAAKIDRFVGVQTSVQLLNFMEQHSWKCLCAMPHTDSAGTRCSFLIEHKEP